MSRRASLAAMLALLTAMYAQAAAIVVDGRKGEAEWAAATRHEQGDVVLSRLSDDDALYFAIEPRLAHPVYVDLYFAGENGVVVNLHASRKIGQRRFPIEARDEERPAFAWGLFPHWQANVGNPDSNANVYEFRVARALFEGRDVRLRVEVQDFYGRNPPIVFPATGTPQSASAWIALPGHYVKDVIPAQAGIQRLSPREK